MVLPWQMVICHQRMAGLPWKKYDLMTHTLRNYSRVSTRLWNNFFWNNFQGIIFEGGRYTIMHVGIWKSWSSPSRYPGIIRFWNNFW
jgi:hypothetical protein